MELPSERDPVWVKIVKGELELSFNFLAARILLSRVKIQMMNSDDPSIPSNGAKDLYELYRRHSRIPVVKQDIDRIYRSNNIV